MKSLDRGATFPRVSVGVLTAFGIELRKLRVEKNKRIFDLAHKLEVSSSSVSAWETGRRDVPPEEVERIGQVLELTKSELDKLKMSAEISRRRVVIEANSPDARQLANAVKRRINSLSSDEIRELLQYFSSSLVRRDRRVRERSREETTRVAQILREGLGLHISKRFDIVDFYDFKLAKIFAETLGDKGIENIRFEIWDDCEMPSDTVGMASVYPPHIVISNSVYEDAARDGYRGRWIMAHELGHLFLLHGIEKIKPEVMTPEVMTRGPHYLIDGSEMSENGPREKVPLKIPSRSSAEAQADDFAAELLMPAAGCAHLGPSNISLRYGVSVRLAIKRLAFLGKPIGLRH
jgi:transcriptional regulator with XRE-family HTH domain